MNASLMEEVLGDREWVLELARGGKRMIWESRYWKDDLLRRAESLERRRTQRRWAAVSLAKVEQEIMLAAYSIRKLAEASKISDAVRDGGLRARVYEAVGNPVTRTNWHRIEDLYDMASPNEAEVPVRDLCNQVIHSYVFLPTLGDAGLEGFLVASDWSKRARLLGVSIESFVGLLRTVADDDPETVSMTWNDEKEDFDVTAGYRP